MLHHFLPYFKGKCLRILCKQKSFAGGGMPVVGTKFGTEECLIGWYTFHFPSLSPFEYEPRDLSHQRHFGQILHDDKTIKKIKLEDIFYVAG